MCTFAVAYEYVNQKCVVSYKFKKCVLSCISKVLFEGFIVDQVS